MHAIRDIYRRIATAEIGYRGKLKTMDIAQCLDDTIETARLVSGLAINRMFHPENSRLMRQGIEQLSGHLICTQFGMREASIAAAKAACLATAIKHDNMRSLAGIRFDPLRMTDIEDATIKTRPELNRLKQVSPEAFFYWYLADGFTR